MAKKTSTTANALDDFLKSVLVFSRTAQHVLESSAVERAVGKPLSPSKVQILRLLGRNKSQTSTQVARYLGVTKPAVSQIIDSMVRDKMVSRKPTKQDRREVALELTATGQKHYRAIRRGQHNVLRKVNQKSRLDAGRWASELSTMAAALALNNGTTPDFCLQCRSFEDETCVQDMTERSCAFVEHGNGTARKRARRARTT